MLNGVKWYDTDGNVVHAHGGCMLKVDDWFYWYGEDRRENYFVSCYRTKDFKSFEFRNHVLTADSKAELSYVSDCDLSLTHKREELSGEWRNWIRFTDDDHVIANIERPKVIYCEKTKKYVMWMHYENGANYDEAACAVATCDTPDGDFVYHGSFRPFGNMSRDCNIFKDGNELYFVSASRDNKDLRIYRMTENYLSVDKQTEILFQNQSREAPAMFRSKDRVYVISSYCTGWEPNQGKFSFTENFGSDSKWSLLENFGDELTFRSQPAFVFECGEGQNKRYYYFGDRWEGSADKYFESTYVVLEIKFDINGNPFIEYSKEAQLPVV